MVDRRSPIWVEACASSTSKKQLYLTLRATQKHQISRLKRGGCSPPQGLRFAQMWGCAQMEPWWIIALINGTKRLSFKVQANGLNET
jgi:hypothetical protein